jgi:hypothetical protein
MKFTEIVTATAMLIVLGIPVDDDYYLYDPFYPGMRLLVFVIENVLSVCRSFASENLRSFALGVEDGGEPARVEEPNLTSSGVPDCLARWLTDVR